MKKLSIKLKRQGAHKNPLYFIVVTEKKMRANTGKVLERIGIFTPIYPKQSDFFFLPHSGPSVVSNISPKIFFFNYKRAAYWLFYKNTILSYRVGKLCSERFFTFFKPAMNYREELWFLQLVWNFFCSWSSKKFDGYVFRKKYLLFLLKTKMETDFNLWNYFKVELATEDTSKEKGLLNYFNLQDFFLKKCENDFAPEQIEINGKLEYITSSDRYLNFKLIFSQKKQQSRQLFFENFKRFRFNYGKAAKSAFGEGRFLSRPTRFTAIYLVKHKRLKKRYRSPFYIILKKNSWFLQKKYSIQVLKQNGIKHWLSFVRNKDNVVWEDEKKDEEISKKKETFDELDCLNNSKLYDYMYRRNILKDLLFFKRQKFINRFDLFFRYNFFSSQKVLFSNFIYKYNKFNLFWQIFYTYKFGENERQAFKIQDYFKDIFTNFIHFLPYQLSFYEYFFSLDKLRNRRWYSKKRSNFWQKSLNYKLNSFLKKKNFKKKKTYY